MNPFECDIAIHQNTLKLFKKLYKINLKWIISKFLSEIIQKEADAITHVNVLFEIIEIY